MDHSGSRHHPFTLDLTGNYAMMKKQPPHSFEVERAVLGALLIDPRVVRPVREILQQDSFYSERHQEIYFTICALHDAGHPVDIITVTDSLNDQSRLEGVGGAYYISQLTAGVNTANTVFHARILKEKALLRELIYTMDSEFTR